MALLLARHGETALNRARFVQPADTPLSALGLRQADALAERLAREFRVAAIVTSDLLRARQSAERVGMRLGLPVQPDPRWRERNFGVLRGRAYDSLGFDPLAMREAPEGGESQAGFEARVAQVLASTVAGSAVFEGDTDLLVVTHGLVLRALLERHLAADESALRAGPPANASLTVVTVSDSACRVVRAACTAHLQQEGATGSAGTVVGI